MDFWLFFCCWNFWQTKCILIKFSKLSWIESILPPPLKKRSTFRNKKNEQHWCRHIYRMRHKIRYKIIKSPSKYYTYIHKRMKKKDKFPKKGKHNFPVQLFKWLIFLYEHWCSSICPQNIFFHILLNFFSFLKKKHK